MTEETRFDRVVTVPLRRPVATIAMLLVVTVASALLWPSVRFEPDVSRVLPKGHPQVQIAELLDERSRPSRTLWLLVEGEHLEATVPALAERFAASPDVVEVITTRTQMFASWSERYERAPLWQLDEAQLDALGEALSPDGLRAAVDNLVLDLADDPVGGRELALRDPLGLRWLLGSAQRFEELGFATGTDLLLLDGRNQALVQLRGTTDAYDADFSRRICEFLEQELTAAGVVAKVFGG